MRRLKELNLKVDKKIKYGLHLDFSVTKQVELFEDFFFSFLIQKFYSNNKNIFCYEDNVNNYIEIPYSVIIDKLSELELSEKKFNDFEDMKVDKKMGLTSFYDVQKKMKN